MSRAGAMYHQACTTCGEEVEHYSDGSPLLTHLRSERHQAAAAAGRTWCGSRRRRAPEEQLELVMAPAGAR